MKKLSEFALVLFVTGTFAFSINLMNANNPKNEEAQVQNEKQTIDQDALQDIATQFAFEFYKEQGYDKSNIKSIMGKGSNWTYKFENNIAINVIMEVNRSSGEILKVNIKRA